MLRQGRWRRFDPPDRARPWPLGVLLAALLAIASLLASSGLAATRAVHSKSKSTLAPRAKTKSTAIALPARWGRPFVIYGPISNDLVATQLAFSDTGSVAAAFGIAEEDYPVAEALLSRSADGTAFGSVRRVPQAQQVLALGYRGKTLELLLGNSPKNLGCCSDVQSVAVTNRSYSRRSTLFAGLTGPASGRLVPLAGRWLAVIGTEHGVQETQSDTRGRFGRRRLLTPRVSAVHSVDATGLRGRHTEVVWTAAPTVFGPLPQVIYRAGGSAASVPGPARVAITAPRGHAVDEVRVAADGAVPTVAWIESWFATSDGSFQSRAYWADLRGTPHPHPLSPPGQLASGLSLASGGDAQVAAFRSCTRANVCVLRAALRPSHHSFAPSQRLPAIDATQNPAVAASPTGQALVGYISPTGHVLAASAGPRSRRFAAAKLISSSNDGADLALSFDPTGASAVAAWTQGSAKESVVGADFMPSVRGR